MPSDYLLEIDGIKGESADSKHKGSIEIESFSWGLSQASSAGSGGGGGAGKVVFQDVRFTTKLSSASPALFLTCATGTHIPKAVLFVRKSGGGQQEYYKVTLQDILVSSYQQAEDDGKGDGVPTDAFSLNFAKIELEYTPDRGGAPVKAGYDIKMNQKI